MTPVDPREDRNELFGRVLRIPLILVAATATAGMLLSGAAERVLAWVTIGVLIATPLIRVVWLIIRWQRRGDQRFVLAGVVLLSVIALGTAVAVL